MFSFSGDYNYGGYNYGDGDDGDDDEADEADEKPLVEAGKPTG